MTIGRVRARATALRGTTGLTGNPGATGPQGDTGQPGYLIAASWAALAAISGTTPLEAAKVYGDSGTHTDPVVGGTVSNSGLFAWSASPAGWKRVGDALADGSSGVLLDAPVLSSNSFTLVPVDVPAPASGMTNSAGGNDAVNLRLIHKTGLLTNGPTGHANYYNTVFALGFNMTSSYTPLNTDMPSASYRIESKYAQGGASDPHMVEFHLASLFPVGEPLNEFRAISVTVPHESADWDSTSCSVGQRGAVHVTWDWDLNVRIYADFRSTVGAIDYMDGGSGQGHPILRFNTNNRTLFQQANAAGTDLLNLMHFDANDALKTEATGTFYFNGPAKTVGFLAAKAMSAHEASGMTADGYIDYKSSSAAITGSLNGRYTVGNATVKIEDQTINGTAGGKVGFKLRASAGSTYIEFRDQTAGEQFSIGFDEPTNTFRLCDRQQGWQFENKFAIEVDYAKFQVTFGYAPKFPGDTVADLPAAAIAGAGSMQYVTDLNSTTPGAAAAGGGANKGFVGCDGSGWHIIAAWA